MLLRMRCPALPSLLLPPVLSLPCASLADFRAVLMRVHCSASNQAAQCSVIITIMLMGASSGACRASLAFPERPILTNRPKQGKTLLNLCVGV